MNAIFIFTSSTISNRYKYNRLKYRVQIPKLPYWPKTRQTGEGSENDWLAALSLPVTALR